MANILARVPKVFEMTGQEEQGSVEFGASPAVLKMRFQRLRPL